MKVKEFIEFLRKFIEKHIESEIDVKFYERNINPPEFFKKSRIKIGLNKSKEIILQNETKLELGGINKKSFSIVLSTNASEYLLDGRITLIGPEINVIKDTNIDFGILILIGSRDFTEKDYEELRQINFISNGIEGFLIRSIPRRFWCRISRDVIKKGFSFELLGNAIMYLYEEKFKDLINSIEVLIVNSYPELITELIKDSSSIQEKFREKWRKKIEDWKKRIDCDYDWGCEICPYRYDCQEIKEVLAEREALDERGNS